MKTNEPNSSEFVEGMRVTSDLVYLCPCPATGFKEVKWGSKVPIKTFYLEGDSLMRVHVAVSKKEWSEYLLKCGPTCTTKEGVATLLNLRRALPTYITAAEIALATEALAKFLASLPGNKKVKEKKPQKPRVSNLERKALTIEKVMEKGIFPFSVRDLLRLLNWRCGEVTREKRKVYRLNKGKS